MKSFFKITFSLILITFIILLHFGLKGEIQAAKIFSPIANTILENIPFIGKSSLKNVVEDSLEDTQGEYSIVAKNLKTGKTLEINENKVYKSASLYKLWVMATAFEKMKKREMKEDEVLSDDIPSLYGKFGLATESADFSDGSIELRTLDAINQMITISHNNSALLLTERVGVSSISAFLKSYGFKDSIMDSPPQTTAKDTALFFEKLYKGEIVNKEYSKEMMDILKKQQINDLIPKLLPGDIKIAHKTGELDEVKHDAGIVFSPNGDYILVLLSSTNNPWEASERIAQISKAVFDYFNN